MREESDMTPFLFTVEMHRLICEAKGESPLFADDIVICSEYREQVEQSIGGSVPFKVGD